jgi:hypothetical protein
MNAPLDDLHAACLQARDLIRAGFVAAKARAAEWEPGDCGTDAGWSDRRSVKR